MPGKRTPVAGRLSAVEVYTREELVRAIGLGRTGLTELRMAGVDPAVISGRHVYFGDEIIAYLKTLRNEQRGTNLSTET